MKITELRRDMLVTDRWFPDWGVGLVLSFQKTRTGRRNRASIRFAGGVVRVFDAAHCQFLERHKKQNK